MRNFKTSKKKRGTYIYYGTDGSRVEITPDMDGVTEVDIEILHEWDDEEVDAERRQEYHIPFRLSEKVCSDEGKEAEHLDLIEDEGPTPLDALLQALEDAEKADLFERLQKAISELTPLQRQTIQKKFYEGRTNVDIAAEAGVSKMAITNRLKKIYATLQKKLEK